MLFLRWKYLLASSVVSIRRQLVRRRISSQKTPPSRDVPICAQEIYFRRRQMIPSRDDRSVELLPFLPARRSSPLREQRICGSNAILNNVASQDRFHDDVSTCDRPDTSWHVFEGRCTSSSDVCKHFVSYNSYTMTGFAHRKFLFENISSSSRSI